MWYFANLLNLIIVILELSHHLIPICAWFLLDLFFNLSQTYLVMWSNMRNKNVLIKTDFVLNPGSGLETGVEPMLLFLHCCPYVPCVMLAASSFHRNDRNRLCLSNYSQWNTFSLSCSFKLVLQTARRFHSRNRSVIDTVARGADVF